MERLSFTRAQCTSGDMVKLSRRKMSSRFLYSEGLRMESASMVCVVSWIVFSVSGDCFNIIHLFWACPNTHWTLHQDDSGRKSNVRSCVADMPSILTLIHPLKYCAWKGQTHIDFGRQCTKIQKQWSWWSINYTAASVLPTTITTQQLFVLVKDYCLCTWKLFTVDRYCH